MYGNRRRIRGAPGRRLLRQRGERLERPNAHLTTAAVPGARASRQRPTTRLSPAPQVPWRESGWRSAPRDRAVPDTGEPVNGHARFPHSRSSKIPPPLVEDRTRRWPVGAVGRPLCDLSTAPWARVSASMATVASMGSRRSRSRRRRLDHPRLQLVLQPIRIASDADRRGVVQNPVEDRAGDHPVPEDVTPAPEALVAGQDRGDQATSNQFLGAEHAAGPSVSSYDTELDAEAEHNVWPGASSYNTELDAELDVADRRRELEAELEALQDALVVIHAELAAADPDLVAAARAELEAAENSSGRGLDWTDPEDEEDDWT